MALRVLCPIIEFNKRTRERHIDIFKYFDMSCAVLILPDPILALSLSSHRKYCTNLLTLTPQCIIFATFKAAWKLNDDDMLLIMLSLDDDAMPFGDPGGG